jgi:hypothetical protein
MAKRCTSEQKPALISHAFFQSISARDNSDSTEEQIIMTIEHVTSTGANLFEEIGLPDAENLKLRAQMQKII